MLTDTFIRTVKPAEKAKKYADGGGLFLYVPLTGSKLWRMGYRFEGKSKLLSFGEYPAVSLKMARDRRDDAKRQLAEGIDPSEQKKQAKVSKLAEVQNTFENIAREWHPVYNANNTLADQRRKMYLFETHIFPQIGKMPITQIEAADILAIAKQHEMKNSADFAHRIVQYCGMVFRYAIAIGKAKHNIVADMRGALRPKKPVHRASITDMQKIGRLLIDIEDYDGYFQVKCALRLMPLLFVRSGELRYAEWTEIDFEDRLWRIPATRMKTRIPHIVPLAKQVVHILLELKEYSGEQRLVFPAVFPTIRGNNRPIAAATMLHGLRGMGYRKQEMCIHGFRSMASTLLNELGYNRDWIERQLAHQEKDSTRAAYNYAQYLPERRRMMDEWADYLDGLRKNARQEQENS